MRDKPDGLVIGPARLLILGMFACVAGSFLALFLSASPASAADTPPADTGALGGLAATVSSVEQRATTVADTIVASDLVSDRLGRVDIPLERLARTATAATTAMTAVPPLATALRLATGLPANVTELLAELPLSIALSVEPPLPGGIAEVPTTSLAVPAPASARATAPSAVAGTTIAEASLVPAPSPPNDHPATPQRALAGATSWSAGSDGGAAAATPGDTAWNPTLSNTRNATQSGSMPSSSNDGSDPAPD